ncbi:MAG: BsuBI/PstI family type II restriction endonuclease, partial [Phototrophicaceae bacterium]
FLRAQRNDRSALCLLALLNLKPDDAWHDAKAVLMGITPIMKFAETYYGVSYAPNTRETFRRQTIHQFVNSGLVRRNPDDPQRPTNSGKTVYQIDENALLLLRSYGTHEWNSKVNNYLINRPGLARRYAVERMKQLVPLKVDVSKRIHLSPGKHSKLIKAIVEDFGPRFVLSGRLIYVGDTGDKWGYFDQEGLSELGVTVDLHGKMPDVVICEQNKKWLVLIEAVTSHGPVDAKRKEELMSLFSEANMGLVFVTAFQDHGTMKRYISEIAWETEVWIADSPSHLIHFDGERFLGPYEQG